MIAINQFLDKIKILESKRNIQNAKMILTMTEARNLHTDITKLLLVLQELSEQSNQSNQSKQPNSTDIIQVETNPGQW